MALTSDGLTQHSFELLLSRLGEDREDAGRRYEELRQRLLKYFIWRRCGEAEECTDEVFNRLCRRIYAKDTIQGSVEAFALGVAQFVWREWLKKPRPVAVDTSWLSAAAPDDGREQESQCLDHCLEKLGPNSRRWVEVFYRDSGRAATRTREALATELGIDINALRVRMHRIRAKLESCVRECLNGNNSPEEAT